MNDEELMKIWAALDTRIETINKRTKIHTIEIKELQKALKKEKPTEEEIYKNGEAEDYT